MKHNYGVCERTDCKEEAQIELCIEHLELAEREARLETIQEIEFFMNNSDWNVELLDKKLNEMKKAMGE